MKAFIIILGALAMGLECLPGSLATDGPSLETIKALPKTYGLLLFRGFEQLDVFGPLEALSLPTFRTKLDLFVIAETLDHPVSPASLPAYNPFNSSFYPTVNATHTFATAPKDIDVLIVLGGVGTAYPGLEHTVKFIKKTYPNLQYLLTVCTGSALVSRAGVLEGRRATTNKASWTDVTGNQAAPGVEWVPKGRWVVEGNIWTSSGISAGIDMTLAFIGEVYGQENATWVANLMEYERNEDPDWDPFAEIWNVPG
jgi:transcriptional regulator GlxA family with amidase domain